MKIDLRWGESAAVRQALIQSLNLNSPIVFSLSELENMGYTSHEGDSDLIELTRQVIKRQTRRDFKHILLTNGATGGITISLRAYAQKAYMGCITHDAPYFSIYPNMIKASGLIHFKGFEGARSIYLIDSPSNPSGLIRDTLVLIPVVWDAVYFNNVYTNGLSKPLQCDIMVGSYSKLTGLNGLRLGWIATNDDLLYERLRNLVEAEYCGLSEPSAKILRELSQKLDWQNFEQIARYKLNCNREEWSKLEKYFEGGKVSDIGMFFYGKMDKSAKKLFEKSNVIWMPGSSLGHNDDFGRFNLGASNELISQAVKEVIKNDTI